MEGTEEQPGIYSRMLKQMFDIAFELQDTSTHVFKISILEVYNEKILDLINYQVRPLEKKKGWVGKYLKIKIGNREIKEEEIEDRRIQLDLREGKNGCFVEGLQCSDISSYEEALEYMRKASINRITVNNKI